MGLSAAAVIVNWKSADECLKLIEDINDKDPGIEIYLVENGSKDGSLGIFMESELDFELISTSENLGFAGGANLGIRKCLSEEYDYICLLNSDIVLPQGAIMKLAHKLNKNPKADLISPVVKTEDDEIWFRRGIINTCSGSAYHVSHRRFFDGRKIETNSSADTEFDSIVRNDYVPFCCTVFRAEAFEENGLLPERYFLYYEDVDYCLRVRENGGVILTDMDVEIEHQVFGSSESGSSTNPVATYYSVRNRFLFFFTRSNLDNKSIFYLSYSMWLILMVLYRIFLWEPRAVIAAIEGFRDAVNGKTGKGRYPSE